MFVGIWQSAATLLLAIVFYVMDIGFMHRYDPARVEGSSRSWGWTFLTMLLAIVGIAQPIFWPGVGLYTGAWWGLVVQAVGVMLILWGLALHGWSRVHLRQFYSERLEFQPEQYLVETGPYAWVRHPIYTSFFMCVVGLLLVNPALPILLVVLYFFVDFSHTVLEEEAQLREQLPYYEDYASQTPRYVPNLSQIVSRISVR